MDTWEYKTIKTDFKGVNGGILEVEEFTDVLNRQGMQGWELVSCFASSQGNGYSREAIAVFKRKK